MLMISPSRIIFRGPLDFIDSPAASQRDYIQPPLRIVPPFGWGVPLQFAFFIIEAIPPRLLVETKMNATRADVCAEKDNLIVALQSFLKECKKKAEAVIQSPSLRPTEPL